MIHSERVCASLAIIELGHLSGILFFFPCDPTKFKEFKKNICFRLFVIIEQYLKGLDQPRNTCTLAFLWMMYRSSQVTDHDQSAKPWDDISLF